MMQRQDLMQWALDEYKKTGRTAVEVHEMSALFDSHFTEAIKQCILGEPIVHAHDQICRACEDLGAASPGPLDPETVRMAKRKPAVAAEKK